MEDGDQKGRKSCPYDSAGILSKLSFWWITSLVKAGWKRPLHIEDLYDISKEDCSELLLPKFDRVWRQQLRRHAEGESISLFATLLRAFWTEWVIPGFLIFLCEMMIMLQPYLIGQLMNYFEEDSTVPAWKAIIISVSLGVSGFVMLVTNPNYFFILERTSIKMKIVVSGLIYRKALRLTSQAYTQTSSGKIVNFLSTDVEKFNITLSTIHYLWVGPLEIVIGSYLIFYFVGPSGFLFLPALVLSSPVLMFSGKVFALLRTNIGRWSDKRIGILSEVIVGIRIVKMYCWEIPFTSIINNLRRKEMFFVWWGLILKVINMSSVLITGKFMMLCIFVGSWMLKKPLSPQIIFMCMGWLRMIQNSFCFWIFYAVENVSQMKASTQRIQEFLLLPEQDATHTSREILHHPVDSKHSVEVIGLSASWDLPSSKVKHEQRQRLGEQAEEKCQLFENKDADYSFGLKNISFTVNKGELVVVVGKVGAGKTSLLMTVLGEMPVKSGSVMVHGSVRYMTQLPWVFSGTVRDNVLFGDGFDRQRYEAVLEACALNKDLAAMPYCDLTRVGERGIMLSGGQKARITLARALYSQADVFLLDDPLSAVDTHVGNHLFHRCICDFLKDKTRILVTHQLQYLKGADRIVVMNEGQIQDIGTYKDLRDRGMDFSSFAHEEEDEIDADHLREKETQNVVKDGEQGEEMEKEAQVTGRVALAVYWRYVKAGGGLLLAPLILTTGILAESSSCVGDWILARWAEGLDRDNQTNLTVAAEAAGGGLRGWALMPDGLRLYILYFVAFAILRIIFSVLYAKMSALASRNLHMQMVDSILGARPCFFDVNPVGRVLNRFSKDIEFLDNNLPRVGYVVIFLSLQVMGLFFVTCLAVPWLFIVILPVIAVVVFIRNFAIQATRDLRRIEATERSPVYAHVSDTLSGLYTVRAFHKQSQFCSEFDHYLNNHTSVFFLYLSACRWFSLRTTFCTYVFFVTAIILCLSLRETVSATLLGLALTYCTLVADPFEFTVRMTAEMENCMTSVERVLEYTGLEQEASRETDHPLPLYWPQHGDLTFSNVTLQYTPHAPPALHQLSFHVHSMEKVGIVGRTGAGKSSILAALFRMTEPQGEIIIDAVNVLHIGLSDLRRHISVIPQDPVLFSGSLRNNLDPFEEFEDKELWHALKQVHLQEKVSSMAGGLSTEIGEGGVKFSVGQRQLVCLARALLRQNKVLVLDEATANVDTATDELIQLTIRTKFKDCTVLTIAHRLHTVMDYDRIMVMEKGELKEFDSPAALLRIQDGYFSHLVQQVGSQHAQLLKALAEKPHLDGRSDRAAATMTVRAPRNVLGDSIA